MQNKFYLTFLIIFGFSFLPLNAALLVYEGFSGYTNSGLGGQNAGDNPNNIGLTGLWNQRGDATSVNATGLTFGSLATSGGAARANQTANRVSAAGVELDLASPATGTLYASMLFNLESVGSHVQNLASMRVSNNIDISSNIRLTTWPLSQGETTYNPGVSYGSSASPAGQALSLTETYMAISIFENVGSTLGAVDGVARSYVLNLSQFEDFVDNGRNQGNLAGRATGTAAGEVAAFSEQILDSGTFNFADGNFLGLSTFTNTGGGTVTVTYDELRWGTDLNSITVIPEASTLTLLGLSLITAVLLHRRK